MSQAEKRLRLIAYLGARNSAIQVGENSAIDDIINAVAASEDDEDQASQQAFQQSQLGYATGAALANKAADVNVYKYQALKSAGQYVFTRTIPNPNSATTVDAGTIVQTSTVPPIAFVTTQVATIPINGTQSNAVGIAAQVAGAAGNVLANTITVLVNAPPTVTGGFNAAPTTGGADPESDPALRIRALAAIAPSNSPYQIEQAAESVPGIFASRVYDWRDGLGNYTAYASDSAGNLSSGLQSAVLAAISAVDGIGLTRHVQTFDPDAVVVSINIVIDTANYNVATVITAVQSQVQSYMNQVEPGVPLRPSDLVQVIFGSMSDAFPAVPGVLGVAVVSPAATVAATPYQLIRATSVTVTQVPA